MLSFLVCGDHVINVIIVSGGLSVYATYGGMCITALYLFIYSLRKYRLTPFYLYHFSTTPMWYYG